MNYTEKQIKRKIDNFEKLSLQLSLKCNKNSNNKDEYKNIMINYINNYFDNIYFVYDKENFSILKIYGGQTERDSGVRLEEHKNEDVRFVGTINKDILKSQNPFIITDLEKYLIVKIGKDKNNFVEILHPLTQKGKPKQTGRFGQQPNHGDIYIHCIFV